MELNCFCDRARHSRDSKVAFWKINSMRASETAEMNFYRLRIHKDQVLGEVERDLFSP